MVIILTFGEYILTKGTKKSLIYVWISISKIFSMKKLNDSIHLIILLLIPSDSGYIVNHFEQCVFLKNFFLYTMNYFHTRGL